MRAGGGQETGPRDENEDSGAMLRKSGAKAPHPRSATTLPNDTSRSERAARTLDIREFFSFFLKEKKFLLKKIALLTAKKKILAALFFFLSM